MVGSTPHRSSCLEDLSVERHLLRKSDPRTRGPPEPCTVCLGRRPGAPKWFPGGRAAFQVQLFGLHDPVTMHRQAPAVPLRWRAPVPVHRQSGGLSSCAPATCTHSANCAADRRDALGAVLGPAVTCPLLCNAKCTVLGCQSCRHPCRDAKAILMVWTVQKTIEILQLQFIDKRDSRDPTVAAR